MKQIEELRKEMNDKIEKRMREIKNEFEQKLNQLENQEEKEDLKPGDIVETEGGFLFFYSGYENNEKRFVKNREQIGNIDNCYSLSNYKKLPICNHKKICAGWMATDDDRKTSL